VNAARLVVVGGGRVVGVVGGFVLDVNPGHIRLPSVRTRGLLLGPRDGDADCGPFVVIVVVFSIGMEAPLSPPPSQVLLCVYSTLMSTSKRKGA